MKILLKEFQEENVDKLVRQMHVAARDSRSGDLQSVALASPTGSGKTAMLTAAIELLLKGDDDYAPMPDATFLWITDQPELNEQTRRKMLATSSILSPEALVVIDASFDRETFKPGAVHFLNTQKIGKEKYLVSPGDKRTYTIWDTIKNTMTAKPGKFFVVIDEAHRGMGESARSRNEATTIIQKFIKGSAGEIPPVPVVVGMSATPKRFHALIEGTERTSRAVNVEPEDVRTSGLLKETITLFRPKQDQPTDMTMLRAAARSLQTFTKQWADYCATQGAAPVRPILVVQVQDAAGTQQVSKTDMAEAIAVLSEELGGPPNDAFAHSFQEGTKVTIGDHEVRYLAPPNIDDDPNVRAVFFKTSLNTGWDCPRAEVMMSFRTAVDATLIAQLVGRMVRTPLAHSVGDFPLLNTVSLYLPHYDKKGLDDVISRLSTPDADLMPPIAVRDGDDVVELHKAPKSEPAFKTLAGLPSYVVPRKRHTSQIRRLMKLARLLSHDEIDEDAISAAKAKLLGMLGAEYNRVRKTKLFKDIVEDRAKVEILAVSWNVGTDESTEGETIKVDIAAENVEDLFDGAGRKIQGLHKEWWRERAAKLDPAGRTKVKLELFALCVDPEVPRKVEKAAQEQTQGWLKKHSGAINKLDEERRALYDEVRALAVESEIAPLIHPPSIDGKKDGKAWPKHLYVNDKGEYPATFNKPETKFLEQELGRKDVVAWLRNTDRKRWALCIPFEVDGEDKPMYPDFLLVRREGEELVVDAAEPHEITFSDAPDKAAGFAKFAAKHADKFGRMLLILLDGTASKTLDLADETVRARVMGVKTTTELRKLFERA